MRPGSASSPAQVRSFNYLGHEGLYHSLMISTGPTFGTISALFGLNHGIIDQSQYSHLVATVIGSAVVLTAIANAYFLPKHPFPKSDAVSELEAKLVQESEEV